MTDTDATPGTAGATPRRITRIDGDRRSTADDALAVEEPLELRVAGRPIAITMRTPGHDADLAAGFALTEGIIRSAGDLLRVEPCAIDEYGNVVVLTLTDAAAVRAIEEAAVERSQRRTFVSSSCGVCGKASIDRIEQQIAPIVGSFTVSRSVLASLPDRMRAAQATFDRTGGLHAAALFTPDGDLLVLREDVGRHNAVDKAIGHMLRAGRTPLDRAVLMVSGRSSFEIVQKAAMAGVAVVAAVSAPSSLAADFADRINQTLVGFLRGDRMNVYAHAERIVEGTG